jgi:hypothetical protein
MPHDQEVRQVSTLAEVEYGFSELSDSDKERFLAGMSPSEESPGKIIIWAIVLLIMAGIIFFFGYLGYLRLAAQEDGAVLFAFATTALGAVAGLLAPSPMAK